MNRYEHDIHDVYAAVTVYVIAWVVASISALATPAAGHLHNVIDFNLPIVVKINSTLDGRLNGD
jgi:hypothetical protein